MALILLLLVVESTFGGNLARNARRWNNACIFADIAPSLEARRGEFEAAVAELNERTNACLSLTRWPDIPPGEDWVYFVGSSSCSSFVGKQISCAYQVINIAPGCSKVEIMHEVMHALGAYHEHQRPDRDAVVTPVPSASRLTPAQWEVNFGIPSDAEAFGGYDLQSVMHYRTTAFSRDGSTETLVPNNDTWRQRINRRRTQLSQGDVALINELVKDKGGEPKPPPPEPECSPFRSGGNGTAPPVYFSHHWCNNNTITRRQHVLPTHDERLCV